MQDAIADGPGALAGLRAGDRILIGRRPADARARRRRRSPAGSPGRRTPAWSSAGAAATDGRAAPRWCARWCRRKPCSARRVGDLLVIRITGFNRQTGARVAHEVEQAPGRDAPARGPGARPARQSRRPAARGGGGGERAAAARRGRGHRRTRPAGQPGLAHRRRRDRRRPAAGGAGGRPLGQCRRGPGGGAGRPRAAPWWSAARRSARAWCRRSTRCPTAASCSSPGAACSPRGGWPIQGLGVLPQVCTSLGQDALQPPARGAGRWHPADAGRHRPPPRRPRAADAGAGAGAAQRLPGRRGPRRGSGRRPHRDRQPGGLRRRAAAGRSRASKRHAPTAARGAPCANRS